MHTAELPPPLLSTAASCFMSWLQQFPKAAAREWLWGSSSCKLWKKPSSGCSKVSSAQQMHTHMGPACQHTPAHLCPHTPSC